MHARRRSLVVAAGVLCAFQIAAQGLPSGARAQDLDAITRETTTLEGQVDALVREPLENDGRRSATHVEERLTDGELFYRLRDFVRASIIFTDIVDNHAEHTAYADALFLLADSLFRAGDHMGARTPLP